MGATSYLSTPIKSRDSKVQSSSSPSWDHSYSITTRTSDGANHRNNVQSTTSISPKTSYKTAVGALRVNCLNPMSALFLDEHCTTTKSGDNSDNHSDLKNHLNSDESAFDLSNTETIERCGIKNKTMDTFHDLSDFARNLSLCSSASSNNSYKESTNEETYNQPLDCTCQRINDTSKSSGDSKKANRLYSDYSQVCSTCEMCYKRSEAFKAAQINKKGESSGVKLKPGDFLPPLYIDTQNYGFLTQKVTQPLDIQMSSPSPLYIVLNPDVSSLDENMLDESITVEAINDLPHCHPHNPDQIMETNCKPATRDDFLTCASNEELDLEALMDLEKYLSQAIPVSHDFSSFDDPTSFNAPLENSTSLRFQDKANYDMKTIDYSLEPERQLSVFLENSDHLPKDEKAVCESLANDMPVQNDMTYSPHRFCIQPSNSPTVEDELLSNHYPQDDLPTSAPYTPNHLELTRIDTQHMQYSELSTGHKKFGDREKNNQDLQLLNLFSDDSSFNFFDTGSTLSSMFISNLC